MATGPVNPKSNLNPLTSIGAAESASKAERSAESTSSKKVSSAGTAANYDVQISDQAKQRALFKEKLMNAAKAEPDIREDRVADLKQRIQAGTYEMDSGKIADGMMREAIREHLAISDK